jgi:hypothetical protein
MAPQINARRFILGLTLLLFGVTAVYQPVTAADASVESRLPLLSTFAKSLINDKAGEVVGIYVPRLFAFPIVQQPGSLAGFVSQTDDTLTQFDWPRLYGIVGLLAHNYLSGAYFVQLSPGQSISLIYGDGRIERYSVTRVHRFRATEPLSPRSNFVNLDTGEGLSAEQLFRFAYQGSRHMTLQTCIARDGDLSWGRLFVIAEPDLSVPSRAQAPRIHVAMVR